MGAETRGSLRAANTNFWNSSHSGRTVCRFARIVTGIGEGKSVFMNRHKRRRRTLRLEQCEARYLLASAPVAVNDTFHVTEDTPFVIETADQVFIETGSTWRYRDDGSNQGVAWQAIGFNDSTWAQGPAELGYGDGDEATEVGFGGDEGNKFATTYFRHAFAVTDPSSVIELLVELRRDDSAAAYLNGTEILRDNLGPNAAFDEFALSTTNDETTLFPFAVDPSLLVAGTNVIAVEIHQANPNSSDISFDLRLSGSVGETGVLSNDTDADGDTLTASLVDAPSNGIVELNADGSLHYFPNINFSGTDTFTYRASDGSLQSNLATVTLNVTAVNDPPSAVDDQYHALSGTLLNAGAEVGVLRNDSDADNDPLSVVLAGDVSHGSLVLGGDGSFSYTPAGGYTGNDQFTYRINDGTVLSPPATANILVTASNQLPVANDDSYTLVEDSTLSVDFPVAPPANEVFFTDFNSGVPPVFTGVTSAAGVAGFAGLGNGGNEFSGAFLRNFSDPEANGDPALPTTLTLAGLPEHDSVDIGFLLALLAGWDGNTANGPRDPDVFNVRVDGEIVFSHTFDTADANDQTYVAPVNGLLALNTDLGFESEVDAAYDMTLEPGLQRIPHSGSTLTVDWLASGSGYRVPTNEGREPESWAIDNVSIVLHLGDAELAEDLTLVTRGSDWKYLDDGSNQGTAWREPAFDDSSWNSGPAELGYGDGDEATVVSFGPDADNKYTTTYFRHAFEVANAAAVTELNLLLKRDDGAVVYLNGTEAVVENIVANPQFDTFAANGSGNERDFLAFSIDPSLLVNGQNVLAVEVHQDDLTSSDVSFDLELTGRAVTAIDSDKLGVLANDVDPEGGPLTTQLVSGPSHGTIDFESDGTFVYIPAANFNGTDSFRYRARDAFGAGNVATVTLTVIPGPNDRPVALDKSYSTNEDTTLSVSLAQGLLVGATDEDMDPLTAAVDTATSHGTLSISTNGSFTYNPTPNYFGPDSFTYVVNDGTTNSLPATVSLNVVSRPDVPIANADQYFFTPGGTHSVFVAQGVLANDVDVDGDSLTAVLISTTADGTLNLNPNGSFSYTPNPGFHGTDTFRYRASDGSSQSQAVTVSLTIDAPPMAVSDNYETEEDMPLVVSALQGVLRNDTDGENDQLTAVLAGNPANGNVALNPNGSFTYTPRQNFNGSDTFTYRANDGDQDSNLTTVSITISPVNDAPTGNADSYEAFQNATLAVNAAEGVLANDVDVDGPTLTAAIAPNGGPQHGQLTLNAGGSFTYEPDMDYVGEDTFSYVLSDGIATTGPVPVTIDVVDDSSAIVINEIMYHPASENVLDEYIELYNRGDRPIDLAGWEFDRGVNYLFPAVTLGAGDYLVVAANVARFNATYPGVGATVIGGWEGQLSNRSEEVGLEDENGRRVDRVTYADEGDWALRRIRPDERRGLNSWEWVAGHDGGGRSLELINPAMSNNRGQNWSASTANQGTPGAVNSVFDTATVPFIENVEHKPAIPTSGQAVTITADLEDEPDTPLTATLFYRIADNSPGAFQSAAMFDDGLHGDDAAGDGEFGVILPPRPDGTVVEFYVRAEDDQGHARTWPAPTDDQGTQGANALYQVDNEVYDGTQPILRVVMTEQERNRLENLNRGSNAQMNATLINLDGTGSNVRYTSAVRYRGNGSRGRQVPNFRVNIPSDDTWQGIDAINLNSQYPHSQVVGMTMFELAGLTAEEATAVQLRINGENLAVQADVQHGSYVRVEVTNSDFTENHFLDDSSGNVYRGINGRLEYLGQNGNSYDGPYDKQTNAAENDWSDLIALTSALDRSQTPDGIFVDTVQQVADIDQWMRFIAVNTLLVNEENGLINGRGDDYSIFCGVNDPRCLLLPHDMDTVFAEGDGSADTATTDRSIFEPREQPAFDRLMEYPEFLDLYYFHLRDLAETIFSPPELGRTLDRLLSGWVDSNTIVDMLLFAAERVDYVLNQIPGNPSPAPVAEISGEPASVTPLNSAVLTIGGEGVVSYRYRVDGGALSPIRPVNTPITLNGLTNGTHMVSVIGANSEGLWQTEAQATVSASWTVDSGFSNLVISEVLAVNESLDHEGTLPDMIELHNRGTTAMSLAGMTLTDDENDPARFTFPAGTNLGAGQRLVVYADDPDGTSGIHIGFGLSRTGETLQLYASNAAGGALLDEVKFGIQLPDLSISRTTDFHWELTPPTMGSANAAATLLGDASSLRINEWFTDGKRINENDFLELYNPTSRPVAVGDLYVTDTIDGGRDRKKITSLSYIAANGYQVFFADDDEGAGADHLNFDLDHIHEPIALYDGELDLIDMVISGPQTTDVSQGLSPDGSDNYAYFGLPTPGLSNVNNPAAVNLINGLRITEIMYHPVGTADEEFIELQNVSSRSLDVTEVRIRGGISYTFPPLVLDPGEVIVLANDLAAFQALYGNQINVVGEFSGNLSNGGEEIELKVPLPLEVDILRFTYNDNPDQNWPTEPDGFGPSLVIIDTEGDYNDGANWRALIVAGGTPGTIRETVDGDFDFDGDLDLDDLEALHAVIVAGNNNDAFDLTNDGLVNFADLTNWVTVQKGTFMADANLDGGVDASDFNRWNDHKFTAAAGWYQGDFDASGAVDGSDFNIWMANRFQAMAAAGDATSAHRTPRAAAADATAAVATPLPQHAIDHALANWAQPATTPEHVTQSELPKELHPSTDSFANIENDFRTASRSMRRTSATARGALGAEQKAKFEQLADQFFASLRVSPSLRCNLGRM